MPKILAYSKDNRFTTDGIMDLHVSWLNQGLTTISNPLFNNLTTTGDVIIGGDLLVQGGSTIVRTDIVEIKDNIIKLNSEEVGSGITMNLSGIEIERGSLANFQAVFQESSQLYKIGNIGNLQAVSTREDSPLNKGVMVYDNLTSRIISSSTIELPITFSAGISSSSSLSGTVIISGGIGINNTANASSSTNGGTITSAGGGAFAKDLYIGNSIITNNGTNNIHHSLNTSSNIKRFSFSLKNTESGSNNGSDLIISSYTDAGALFQELLTFIRSTGSIETPAFFNINNTIDAIDINNGGAFTSAGGGAIKKKLFIGGNLSVTGSTTLSTNIGQLSVNGTNGINVSVVNNSIIQASTGTMTINGVGLNLGGGSGNTVVTSSSSISLSSGTGGITLNTTDTNIGIKIGTTVSGIPITIGHSVSDVIIADNLIVNGDFTVLGIKTEVNTTSLTILDNLILVNSAPSGTSDGGYLIKRYQTNNNSSTGDVVGDIPKYISTFQSGSAIPGTLVLNTAAFNTDDYYKGWWIKITSGSGINQVRQIKSYIGATRTATIYLTVENGLNLVTPPVSGDSYELYDASYAGIYFSEINNEIRFAYVPYLIDTGIIDPPSTYIDIRVNNLTAQNNLNVLNDAVVSGDLTVTGNLSYGVSIPSTSYSNLINITGFVTNNNTKLIKNGNEYLFSTVFIFTPSTGGILTSFEFTVPDISVNFVNTYDIVSTVSGYSNTLDPVNLNNIVSYAVIGSVRAKCKLTSNDISPHILTLILRYTII